MRIASFFLISAMVNALLCACSLTSTGAGVSPPESPIATVSSPTTLAQYRGSNWAPNVGVAARRGAYVLSWSDPSGNAGAVLGYRGSEKDNRGPVCNIPVLNVSSISTDPRGNLMTIDGNDATVIVYGGTALCGQMLGSVTDGLGTPVDAASLDAAHGRIYLAQPNGEYHRHGSVAVCTLSGGCTSKLRADALRGNLFDVTVDANGGVYAVGYTTVHDHHTTMVYWANGAGPGVQITAYKNTYTGGLNIDSSGNIIALDYTDVWIYSGCPAACVAHGPFPLMSPSGRASLDVRNNTYEVSNFSFGRVDVYAYNGTAGITYEYSYDRGMSTVVGVAIDPAAE